MVPALLRLLLPCVCDTLGMCLPKTPKTHITGSRSSNVDGSRSTDWNAAERDNRRAGPTCAQVVGLVLAVVSMLVMVVLMASASRNTYITRDLSWSRVSCS